MLLEIHRPHKSEPQVPTMESKGSPVQLLEILPGSEGGVMDRPNDPPRTLPEITLTVEGDHTSSVAPSEAPTPLQNSIAASRESLIPEKDQENWKTIAIQVFIPFLIAGMGMVGAGLVLDIVQHWIVFREVPELFILVPALLGLKGNLEMTLAARLSTQANLGNMDTTKAQWSMAVGNLSLVQCQAIVVGFLASVVAVVMGVVFDGQFNFSHALLLCASSIVTAALASCALGVVMVAVIILSRKCNINPDNVATPIAASLGDITTLGLLAWLASIIFNSLESDRWLAPVVIAGYFFITPLWVWLARKNEYTRIVLYTGWPPVLIAMLISSMGGIILDQAVTRFAGIAVFQPVINGVGGNLVAVQASRISTSLHRDAVPGALIHPNERVFMNPLKVFTRKGTHARTARVLLLMVIPGHLLFSYTISYFQAGHTSPTFLFLMAYLSAAVIQVALLLCIAQMLTSWLWVHKIDPDTSAIPYLTALGDLLGTGLLFLAFEFLYASGEKVANGV